MLQPTAPLPAAPSGLSLLERRRRVLMPCLYNFFGDDALELVRGEGAYLWDSQGRRYLDCFAGVAVVSLGHCHPEVVAAAAAQLSTLQHTTTLHLTEPMVTLAERLLEVAPASLSRVFFCADGSGAIEGALCAARLATGRPNFLALDRGLHGRTAMGMALTGLPMWKIDPFPAASVRHLGSPLGRTAADCAAEMRAAIESAPPHSFAAFVAEPILGNGGIVVPPPGYFGAIKRVLDEYGILLIVDEVQTGFCRTGRWFGIDHEDVLPDLMAVAKAMANGLPAAAWLASEAVAQSFTKPAASTFGGNLPAMAAGLAVLEIMQREHVAERVAEVGKRFGRRLADLRRDFPDRICDVRGRGLMWGVEISGNSRHSGAAATDAILMEMRRQGFLAGKAGPGRDVVVFQPPLITEEADLMAAADALGEAIASLPQ